MSDWTDLGFPAPQSGNYGFDRDVGILRTPFESAWPRQKQGWKDKRETFNVWCMITSTQLAAAETFFSDAAYDWFTMPLRAGGAAGLSDYTVRALGPCAFIPLGMDRWKAQFKIETQIAADAPDLTDHGYSLVEETCCLADDIQCCESEAPVTTCLESAFSSTYTADTANDVSTTSYVGMAVSSDGLVIAIGAPTYNSNRGRVQVYDKAETSWTLRGDVIPVGVSVGYAFGSDCALTPDGSTLIVGSVSWNAGQGAVHTFDWNGSSWDQRGSILTPPVGSRTYGYGGGVSVTADGNLLFVGHWKEDDTPETSNGMVYVYERNGTAWDPLTTISVAGGGGGSDAFGYDVAVTADGTRLAVCAGSFTNNGYTSSGCLYIYDGSYDSWTLTHGELEAPTPVWNGQFGVDLAWVGNDILFVGSEDYDYQIYRIDLSTVTPVFASVATIDDADPGSGYSSCFDITGDACMLLMHTYTYNNIIAFVPPA